MVMVRVMEMTALAEKERQSKLMKIRNFDTDLRLVQWLDRSISYKVGEKATCLWLWKNRWADWRLVFQCCSPQNYHLLWRREKALHYLEGIGFQPLNWTGNRSSKWRSIVHFKVFSVRFLRSLALYKGWKAEYMSTLKPHPFFIKARTVPLALRDKVEADLEQLLKEDIIEPVGFSKWAAPIVPVPKGIIPSEFVTSCSLINSTTHASTHPQLLTSNTHPFPPDTLQLGYGHRPDSWSEYNQNTTLG